MLRSLITVCFLLFALQGHAAKPALSAYEYKQLNAAFKSMEAGQWKQANQQLLAAEQKVKSDYAKALVQHNLAQVALQQERYSSAIKYLKATQALKALPDAQQINLLRTLGQLYCMQEAWKSCVSNLQQWMASPGVSVKANDHLMMAQAYSQLKRWKSLLPHITKAIRYKGIAPESWYQLKIAAHIELKQWKQAAKQQQVVIQHYSSNPKQWRQLVSLQIQAGDRKSALATQRLGYERKLLVSGKDYELLAQLMLRSGIPYHAARVIEQGFQKGVIKQNAKNLRLLSSAWIRAQEKPKAIKVLSKLNSIAPSEKVSLQLAQIQLQEKRWNQAEKTLSNLLTRKPKKIAQIKLMQGIAQINQKHFEQARISLAAAEGDAKYGKMAANWIRYLDQMEMDLQAKG